jgi:hypothetical protein
MEEWDCNENQGRRKDQVELAYKVLFFTTILISSLIIANSIYLHIN